MTIYNVHIYREMRLYFPGIDAGTPEEAARIAADRLTGEAETVEDCDGESLAALVDVAGDEDFSQSVAIDFEPERQRKAAPELLDALNYLLEQTVDMDLKYGISLSEGEEDARAKALAAIAKAAEIQPDGGRQP
jgi:hypothetical protein